MFNALHCGYIYENEIKKTVPLIIASKNKIIKNKCIK